MGGGSGKGSLAATTPTRGPVCMKAPTKGRLRKGKKGGVEGGRLPRAGECEQSTILPARRQNRDWGKKREGNLKGTIM